MAYTYITMYCYHCGNDCDPKHPIVFDDKHFCCQGCQTVYEILSANKLDKYYAYEQTPGARPEEAQQKYHCRNYIRAYYTP